MVSLLLIGLLTGNKAHADDPTFINLNEKAPYSGLLFSERKAQELRSELLESDKTKLLYETEKHRSEKLGQIINLKDSEIELYRKQNERLVRTSDRSDTMKYIWFGLGILATGVAVYGAGGLAR